MPRDGAGNYSLPAGNPVVTLTPISSAWANPTMADIAQALTDSLSPAKLGADGIAVRTSSTTWSARSVVAGANIAVTNGSGVSGNITVALVPNLVLDTANASIEMGAVGTTNTPFIDFHSSASVTDYDVRFFVYGGTGVTGNGDLAIICGTATINGNPVFTAGTAPDLSAIEALGGTGIAVRAAANTWAQREIVAGLNILVANGGGEAGNPTISTVDNPTFGTSVTLNGNNAHIELGNSTGTHTYLDFRTLNGDFDVRLECAAASGALGGGLFNVSAGGFTWNGFPVLCTGNFAAELPDLGAIEALAGTGIAVRNGANSWVQRAVVGSTNINITNGGGEAGNIVVNLNPSLELGTAGVGGTPVIDFHSYAGVTDFDARLFAFGGTGATGGGGLDIQCAALQHNGYEIWNDLNGGGKVQGLVSSSHGANGYQMLIDGSILAWGSATITANSNGIVSLPLTFPNNHFQSFATMDIIGSFNNTEFQCAARPNGNAQVALGNTENFDHLIRFFCIGN